MYIYRMKNIDKSIGEIEGNNTKETYREFIETSCKVFDLNPGKIDDYNDLMLTMMIEFLDGLWEDVLANQENESIEHTS